MIRSQRLCDSVERRTSEQTFQVSTIGIAFVLSVASKRHIQQLKDVSMSQNIRMKRTVTVGSVQELLTAVGTPETGMIDVTEDLWNLPSFLLPAGKGLRSAQGVRRQLQFDKDRDGIRLGGNNTLHNLRICADAASHAILLDPEVQDLGLLKLTGITTTGRVTLISNTAKSRGVVMVEALHIASADATATAEMPRGFGVFVLQGAFTLWIRKEDSSVTAELLDLKVGELGAPVRGSGIFVGGADFDADTLRVERLVTGPVYSDGGIAEGTPDKISGGIFVLQGAYVSSVVNRGTVTTFGVNDMALDNWGTVERWVAEQKITTYGTSGIGFVNFGTLDSLHLKGPIETHGRGARGFNVYDGAVREAIFDKITTLGDGSVGVQISRPVGTLQLRRGIETHGGSGMSLVKGAQQELRAIALSITPEGQIEDLRIRGGLITHGKGIPALEQAGRVARLYIEGEFAPKGGV